VFRKKRTHSQVMMSELSESFDHLTQAANAAANGVNATVGPKWNSTRDAVRPGVKKATKAAAGLGTAMSAMALSARDEAAKAGRKGRTMTKGPKAKRRGNRRWLMWAGLAGAGAAAGTAGAMAARRRRRAQWDEYDAQVALDQATRDTATVIDASREDATVTGTAKAPRPETTGGDVSSKNSHPS
jgi:hypothetical protein